MDRSTSRETATKIVSTVATDHVGVKANDLISSGFSAIFSDNFSLLSNPLNHLHSENKQTQVPLLLLPALTKIQEGPQGHFPIQTTVERITHIPKLQLFSIFPLER